MKLSQEKWLQDCNNWKWSCPTSLPVGSNKALSIPTSLLNFMLQFDKKLKWFLMPWMKPTKSFRSNFLRFWYFILLSALWFNKKFHKDVLHLIWISCLQLSFNQLSQSWYHFYWQNVIWNSIVCLLFCFLKVMPVKQDKWNLFRVKIQLKIPQGIMPPYLNLLSAVKLSTNCRNLDIIFLDLISY